MATVTPDVAAVDGELQKEVSTGSAASTDEAALATVDSDCSEPSPVAEKVVCRRCNQETDPKEALCQDKFRADLRWTCKACHALITQLNRHGVELKTVLTETESTAFFQKCKLARMNSADQRLAYSQARGVLKQEMIESASKVSSEGETGQFQPLSFWELKGYNTEKIEASAECRDHPLLGKTYKVEIESTSVQRIHSVTEQRILPMEADARERVLARTAPAAPLSAPMDLPQAPEDAPQGGKKRKTPDEKKALQEEAKAQRMADKKRRKTETAACAAAAKLLPALKTCHEKMAGCNEKIAELSSVVALPDASKEQLDAAQIKLDSALANCTKLLGITAKGGSLCLVPSDQLATDKDLGTVVKDGNAAIRMAQAFIRVNKENLPKKAAKAKAKK